VIVKFKTDILSNSDNDRKLDDFIHFFTTGQHRFSSDPKDVTAFENSTWKKSLPGSTRDLLEEGSSSHGDDSKLEVVISGENNDTYFSLQEGFIYLDSTLYILVENVEYEKSFYLKIIKEFDPSGDLLKAFRNKWLNFYHGGGSGIDNVIRTNITRDDTTPSCFTKSLERYLRFFVIKDSDREYCIIKHEEGETTIEQQPLAESKTKFLDDNNVPYHILYKREKENYMPDRIYDGFQHKKLLKNFAQSYLRLDHPQKDFLDIEKGFLIPGSNPKKVKDRATLKPEVRNLYKNISDKDYNILGLGFEYPNLKSKFSDNFEHTTKDDLEKRIKKQPPIKSNHDGVERNEFEHIIHEIKRLL